MNAYYQFSMVEGYSNATTKMVESEKIISPQKEQAIVEEEVSTVMADDGGKGTSTLLQEAPTREPVKEPALVEPTKEPTSVSDETTINVYADEGKVSTGKATTGGGGGGGFSPPSSKKSTKAGASAPKKSFIPLAAIGAGIAILILKPF